MKKRTVEYWIEDVTVRFRSDVFDGEIGDTEVYFNGAFMCCIAGGDIEAFKNELSALVARYKI
jgi:hypothetical protein